MSTHVLRSVVGNPPDTALFAVISLGKCVALFIQRFIRQLAIAVREKEFRSGQAPIDHGLHSIRFFGFVQNSCPSLDEAPPQE
jgi:hypothetical protein